MTTLITGAGLIGCQTASLLVARGEKPVLLDLRPSPDAIRSVLPDGAVIVEAGDVRDRAAMLGLFKRHSIDKVLHTAAALSLAIRQTPSLAAEVNIGGTVNLLDAARDVGARRFVFSSSTTVFFPSFRRPTTAPVPEDFAFHSVSERPGNLYSASKLSAEFFVQHYADQFGLSAGALRYSAVLGLWAGPNNALPGKLLAQLLGDGAQAGRVKITEPLILWTGGEDFIDARDIATANVAALDAPSLPSRIYTVASGRMSTFADFLAAAREVRPDLEIDHDPIPATGFAGFAWPRMTPFDISLAKTELGFTASHDLVSSFRAARPFISA